MNILEFHKKVEAAHTIFRSVLGKSTPDHIFEQRKLVLSADGRRLYEQTSNGGVLAEAVFEQDFMRKVGPIDLDHYTSFAGFEGILNSARLHLHAVANHLDNDEFTTFAKDHQLVGYFNDNEEGKKIYRELSEDLFFISMTEPDISDEAGLWNTFSDEGRGVRLRLRVTPKPPSDMRMIAYRTSKQTALKQINDALASEDLVYLPWTISRICAFYLPIGFRYEREVRLLVKRFPSGVDKTMKWNGQSVWPVSLARTGQATGDTWCQIELVGIKAGPKCGLISAQRVVDASPFAGLSIS